MKQKSKPKRNINFVLLGDDDSGKTTLLSLLLENCGKINDDNVKKFERQVTRKLSSEAQVASEMRNFETDKYIFHLLNTPGDRNFTSTMIGSHSRADVAILTIPGVVDEFEALFTEKCPSKEMVQAALNLDVKEIIVAFTKMDIASPSYSKSDFQSCASKMLRFLKKIGYKSQGIQFIPISGTEGVNVTSANTSRTLSAWYQGRHLVGALEDIKPHPRHNEMPLRMPVNEVYFIENMGTVAVGIVENGKVSPETVVQLAPSGKKSAVGFVKIDGARVSEAGARNHVEILVKDLTPEDVFRGDVFYDSAVQKRHVPAEAISFTATIAVKKAPELLSKGSTVTVECHSSSSPCIVDSIAWNLQQDTKARELEKYPDLVKSGSGAIIKFKPQAPFVVEKAREFPALGRIIVREGNRILAVGVITAVEKGK